MYLSALLVLLFVLFESIVFFITFSFFLLLYFVLKFLQFNFFI